MKKIIIALGVLIIGIGIANKLNTTSPEKLFSFPNIPDFFKEITLKKPVLSPTKSPEKPPVIVKGSEEELLVNTIDRALPSVVTVGINVTFQERGRIEIDPFDPFGGFGGFRQVPGQTKQVEQNIGSGFIVSEDGFVITNKHVVSREDAEYKILLNNEETYKVEKMYRDPLNDLAILKINPKEKLAALTLGDSDNLKLGQTTIAIGTPLGEFTNSVTTGIISGLGRGITAGSPFEGFVEKLDNVIQTDAAISPGNSGGPLLNLSGQVIGINTAVSSEGENIGFAIPVNTVKALLAAFESRGGSFERPYMGIQYQMIDRRTAIANDLVEGAYVEEVIADSPADKAGLQEEDVITKIDDERLSGTDEQSIMKVLLNKKVGQVITVTYWRNGEEKTTTIRLENYDSST